MCLAYVAIQPEADWPLFIAANRDEFHHRPCLPAAPWPDAPHVIAGVDCQALGTWLGITRNGRYALVTNYRDPASTKAKAVSRGELTRQFLLNNETVSTYAAHVHHTADAYNGFNLIVGDLTQAYYIANRAKQSHPEVLEPGRYILSNHLLDTPWPKAQRLRSALDNLPLDQLDRSLTPVFELLKDNTIAEDHLMPQTGLSYEREKLLSSPFIVSPDYGTRCSTVIAVHASGRAIFSEISYDAQGIMTQRHDWPFTVESNNGLNVHMPSG